MLIMITFEIMRVIVKMLHYMKKMMICHQYLWDSHQLQLMPLFQGNCVVLRELENLQSVFNLRGKKCGKQKLYHELLLSSVILLIISTIVNTLFMDV